MITGRRAGNWGVLVVAAVVLAGCVAVDRQPGIPADRRQAAEKPAARNSLDDPSLTRTTCPVDDTGRDTCVKFLHQQPREFWEQYQREAPALLQGFLACEDVRTEFADWVRNVRDDLWEKDRQENMNGGYLPHVIVAESNHTIGQMAAAYETEYRQIANSGARPDLCRERALYWKTQILGISEKFPPLQQ